MHEFQTPLTVDVPFAGPKCPICHLNMKMIAEINITGADVCVTGRSGLSNSIMSSKVMSQVANTRVEHQCQPNLP